jgi:hypothetical protein
MIEYTWSFSDPKVIKNRNGLTDIIQEFRWTLTARDTVNNITKSTSAIMLLTGEPDVENFVNFTDVDNDWLINVMETAEPSVNVESIKSGLVSYINLELEPQTEEKAFNF